jgi:hypothetical protein
MQSEQIMPAMLDNVGTKPAGTRPKEGQGKPSMAVVNFWLDAGLFVNLIFIMWVSVMLQFIFPPPTEAAGWSLWGLSYNDWHNLQFYAFCVFALLAVEHLVLHWNWICSVTATQVLRSKTRPDEGAQAVYGVGTFIVVLVTVMGTLIAALAAVSPPAH